MVSCATTAEAVPSGQTYTSLQTAARVCNTGDGACQDGSVDSQPSDSSTTTAYLSWQACNGLQGRQRELLQALHDQGVVMHASSARKPEEQPRGQQSRHRYRLSYAGEVPMDGSCLFSAVAVAMGNTPSTAAELRRKAVARFRQDCTQGCTEDAVDRVIANLYCPDLTQGWGINFVQQHKLLLQRMDVQKVAAAVDQLVATGMDLHQAQEAAYKDVCTPVRDALSWAEYMSCDGSEHGTQVVTLQYVEDGLLSAAVDSNTAAFGDDIAIQSLANELGREIIVVQVHAADSDSDAALFFFQHAPKRPVQDGQQLSTAAAAAATVCVDPSVAVSQMPIFLLMKGAQWVAAGADHYEPMYCSKMMDDGSEPAFVI